MHAGWACGRRSVPHCARCAWGWRCEQHVVLCRCAWGVPCVTLLRVRPLVFGAAFCFQLAAALCICSCQGRPRFGLRWGKVGVVGGSILPVVLVLVLLGLFRSGLSAAPTPCASQLRCAAAEELLYRLRGEGHFTCPLVPIQIPPAVCGWSAFASCASWCRLCAACASCCVGPGCDCDCGGGRGS